MINIQKLQFELTQAGIPIFGVSSDGRIDFKPEATDIQKKQAQDIMANQNDYWYVDERIKAYPSLGDQLDMIYHDRVNGTDNWFNLIKSIKDKYPK